MFFDIWGSRIYNELKGILILNRFFWYKVKIFIDIGLLILKFSKSRECWDDNLYCRGENRELKVCGIY